MASEGLAKVVDGNGRTWARGAEVKGRPGVTVEDVTRVGSFVTVRFGASVKVPRMPPPLVLHVQDLRAVESEK